jgi:hydrogenase/urease accessory protein HupE
MGVVLALVAALVVALSASRADAHAIGLSTGEYVAKGSTLRAKLAFARAEVADLVPSLDANRDGHVTAVEVSDAKPVLEAKVLGALRVRAGGAACSSSLVDAALTEQDGLSIEARFECPSATTIDVEVALLADLAHGHRHVARAVSGDTTHDEVLFRGHETFSVATTAAPAAAPAESPSPAPASGSPAWSFFRMGVEHILTGYDHLVFLLGLVLLRARVKQLLAVVTAFTVAHSITLALAVLGVLAPSPKIVEPAIALSIAYVGVENFFVKDGGKRWRITFPFGLVHGFGFAGALREISLPRAEVPTTLVSFNLGVEAGQLAVMAVLLPIVFALRDRQKWFDPQGVRFLSGAVALAGGVWFVIRIASRG